MIKAKSTIGIPATRRNMLALAAGLFATAALPRMAVSSPLAGWVTETSLSRRRSLSSPVTLLGASSGPRATLRIGRRDFGNFSMTERLALSHGTLATYRGPSGVLRVLSDADGKALRIVLSEAGGRLTSFRKA